MSDTNYIIISIGLASYALTSQLSKKDSSLQILITMRDVMVFSTICSPATALANANA